MAVLNAAAPSAEILEGTSDNRLALAMVKSALEELSASNVQLSREDGHDDFDAGVREGYLLGLQVGLTMVVQGALATGCNFAEHDGQR